ncbi:MAG: MFS transporter [Anaerolineae bacterium]|nr:MFS transporter [Anaerolineae bacterium]
MQRFWSFTAHYSHQFWLLFAGYIISRTGSGLIWPFLTIYMREQLDVPLSTITILFSIQAASGLVSTWLLSPMMDRFGRKRIMVFSLVASALILIAMRSAYSLPAWGVLIALYGANNPLFSVGGNAMVADLVPEDRRAGAYALIRMAQNLGIAIGPVIGGMLIVISYGLTYYITATVNIILAILIFLFLAESLPKRKADEPAPPDGGYLQLLKDRPFLIFCGIFVLIEMVVTLVFSLLSVYAKENYGILENQYGFLVAINATMVVLFQYGITRISERYRQLWVMIIGALLYAVGSASIALGTSFAAFAISMVVITTGELLAAPTSLALVARMAPTEMRARYMGVYTLTFTIASGIAPLIGGLLNDYIGPDAIWYGGMVMGLTAAIGFYWMLHAGMLAKEQRKEILQAVSGD